MRDNRLDYYESSQITVVKSFLTLGQGINLFLLIFINFINFIMEGSNPGTPFCFKTVNPMKTFFLRHCGKAEQAFPV
jgi:hypothetical protein